MTTRTDSPARHRWPARIGTAIAGLLAALLVAGCGGGGDDAPAPPPPVPVGDPVSATLGAAGGEIRFTASGVAGRLEIPAGVLATEIAITVTPRAPQAGEWARVSITGTEATLETPATLTLELPEGATLDPLAAVTQRQGGADVPLPASTLDPATRTLRVQMRWLGRAGATAGALAGATGRDARALEVQIPPEWTGELIVVQRFLVQLRVAAAELQYAAMTALGSYGDAVSLSQAIAALIQSSGLDGYEEDAVPWLNRTKTSACSQLGSVIAAARADVVDDKDDFKRLSAPILYWKSIVQALGGEPCRDLDPDAMLQKKMSETEEWLRSRNIALAAQVQRKRALGARALAVAGPGDYTDLVLPVRDANDLSHEVRVLGSPGDATLLKDHLVDPVTGPFRQSAWDTAGTHATQDHYRQVIAAFGTTGPLVDDLQLAATTLRAGAYTDAGATTLIDESSLGRRARPADAVKAGTVAARRGATLRLSGPIDVLNCPTAATETLAVDFAGQPVLTRPSSGSRLLDGNLDFNVDALLRGAGIDPAQATQHLLRLRRVGSSCNAAFGIGDATVAEITLDFATKLGRTELPGGQLEAAVGDAQGNLYVAGRNAAAFGLAGPAGYYFIAKLDAAMKAVWIVPYAHGDRGIVGIGIDGAGRLSVGGNTAGYDLFVTHFSATDGTELWDRAFGSAVLDSAGALAMDRDGNTWFGGSTQGGGLGGSPPDTTRPYNFVFKFDRNGNTLWSRTTGDEGINGLALDSAGNAYFTTQTPTGEKIVGDRDPPCTNTDFGQVVASLGPDGALRWKSLLDSDDREGGRTIGVTGDGVVLASYARYPTCGGGITASTRQLSAASGGGGTIGTVIGEGRSASDAEGNLCTVGRDPRASGNTYLHCFDRSGSLRWSKTFAGTEASVVAIDGKGIVTIGGASGPGEAGFYARMRLRDGMP